MKRKLDVDVKVGDWVKFRFIGRRDGFTPLGVVEFLDKKEDSWLEITAIDPRANSWIRFDDFDYLESEDNCQFHISFITEIARKVKDTKISRAFYKNKIVKAESGYLLIEVGV